MLSGHDHDYERFAPIGLKGQVEMSRGVRQFVVGTGGAGLRGVEALREGSEAMSSSAYGVLQLLLHADRYDWRFLAANDTTFTDQGSGICVPTE